MMTVIACIWRGTCEKPTSAPGMAAAECSLISLADAGAALLVALLHLLLWHTMVARVALACPTVCLTDCIARLGRCVATD